MRNFVVTIDGKTYSVGVEEVGESVGEVSIAPAKVAEAPSPRQRQLPPTVKRFCRLSPDSLRIFSLRTALPSRRTSL